jgi:hypothetical protein
VACLVGAAGLFSNHMLARALLLTTALASAVVVVWDVRRRPSKRARGTLHVLVPPRMRVQQSTASTSPQTFADKMRPRREAELHRLHVEERQARERDDEP